jgi:hypothetical protein
MEDEPRMNRIRNTSGALTACVVAVAVVAPLVGIALALDGPSAAAAFGPYAKKVTASWDDRFLYVESDGMPDRKSVV